MHPQLSEKHVLCIGADLGLNLSDDALLQSIPANSQLRLDVSKGAYLHRADTLARGFEQEVTAVHNTRTCAVVDEPIMVHSRPAEMKSLPLVRNVCKLRYHLVYENQQVANLARQISHVCVKKLGRAICRRFCPGHSHPIGLQSWNQSQSQSTCAGMLALPHTKFHLKIAVCLHPGCIQAGNDCRGKQCLIILQCNCSAVVYISVAVELHHCTCWGRSSKQGV